MTPRRRRAERRAAQREAQARAREARAEQPARQTAVDVSAPPAASQTTGPWLPFLWQTALVAIVALAVSANAVRNDFVYDDTRIIRDNPIVQGPIDLEVIFGSSYWGQVEVEDALYRPLTVLSFALEQHTFGPGPFPTHLINVILNAAVAVTLFAFLSQLLVGSRVPLFAALLFAVHPIHAEVVANGVGRAELLAALLSLMAMIAHLRFVRGLRVNRAADVEPPVPRAAGIATGLLVVSLLYFIALLCKESAAVVPGLLFLAEWFMVERGRLRHMLLRIPLFLLYAAPLAVYVILRGDVVGLAAPPAPEILENVSALDRRLFAAGSLVQQITQMLVPQGFVPDYRNYAAPPPAGVNHLLTLLVSGALVALAIWLWRRRQFAALLGLAWFGLAILPTANLLVTIGTLRGDRLMYFPSAGVCLALAVGLVALGRLHRLLPVTALVALLVWHGVFTMMQNTLWRDDLSLWSATVESNPGSAHAHRNLADALMDREEDPERAMELYGRAVALREGAGFFYADARTQWAIMLRREGRNDEAEALLRRVVEERPTHFVALMNLGQILNERAAERSEAIELFERAAEREPRNYHAPANLASALMREGRLEEALAAVDRSIALNDRQRYVWSIRASILRRMDRAEEAEEATERARGLP